MLFIHMLEQNFDDFPYNILILKKDIFRKFLKLLKNDWDFLKCIPIFNINLLISFNVETFRDFYKYSLIFNYIQRLLINYLYHRISNSYKNKSLPYQRYLNLIIVLDSTNCNKFARNVYNVLPHVKILHLKITNIWMF